MDHHHNSDVTSSPAPVINQPVISEHAKMFNYFYASWDAVILFREWQTQNSTHYALSCLAVAVIAFLLEGLKLLRLYASKRSRCQRTLIPNSSIHSDIKRSPDSDMQRFSIESPASPEHCASSLDRKQQSWRTSCYRLSLHLVGHHLLQSILYMLQLSISYCLMLVFMSFNIGLCLSIIFGFGTGYFVFGLVQELSLMCADGNDSDLHCP